MLSITIALLIAVSIYSYLIKHRAKQKHLLRYYLKTKYFFEQNKTKRSSKTKTFIAILRHK